MYKTTTLLTLFLLGIVFSCISQASSYPVTTFDGTGSNSRIHLQAWDSKYTIEDEDVRFVASDSINVSAIILPEAEDIGQSAELYIVAFLDGIAFFRNSSGIWVRWDGPLQHAETRVLESEEYIEIASGLSGLVGVFDIFVGYRNRNNDIVYNSSSMYFTVTNGYNNIITIGQSGQFSGCNGLQMALNIAQDWDEIRIQQGTYNCTGLELTDSHDYQYGIKISGGWDSSFETQTHDPSLTVIDGGNPLIEDVGSTDECLEAGGWYWGGSSPCYFEEPQSARILETNNERVSLEYMSFQNAYHLEGGAVLMGVSNQLYSKIYRCHFSNNTTISGNGGALKNIGTISNSMFESNHAYNGGSVDNVKIIKNSEFHNNSAVVRGGAVLSTANIIGSEFASNTASAGGAINTYHNHDTVIINNIFTNNNATRGGAIHAESYQHKMINNFFNGNIATSSGGAISNEGRSSIFVNNTFVNNSAGEYGGGAFYGIGTIVNSIFSDNMSTGGINDITPDGDLTIDYSLFSMLDGSADIGPHNIFEAPSFSDSDNNDFHLQANSPAVNSGYGGDLMLNKINDNYITSYLLPYLRNNQGSYVDLDNQSRLVGEGIDMGVYERQ
jgi:hypothetical protein